MGSVSACVLRVQLVPAATCTKHSHRVQKQMPDAGKKRSGTAEKTRTGAFKRRKSDMFEKKARAARKQSEEEQGTAHKSTAQPRERHWHSSGGLEAIMLGRREWRRRGRGKK